MAIEFEMTNGRQVYIRKLMTGPCDLVSFGCPNAMLDDFVTQGIVRVEYIDRTIELTEAGREWAEAKGLS